MSDSRLPSNLFKDIDDIEVRVAALARQASSPASFFVSDDPLLGIVLRSPNLHYWRLTINNVGVVAWEDIGTDKPAL